MRIELSSARLLVVGALLMGSAPFAGAQVPTPPPLPSPPGAGARDATKSVFTEDHTVEAGETVDDVVVLGGDLRIRGKVTGDAVVVGGRLILEESGLVEGDATVTGGSIVENGGRIRGEMRMLDAVGNEVEGEARRAAAEGRAAADEARREAEMVRHEAHQEMARHTRAARFGHERGWFDPIRRGFAGLISTLAFGLVLASLGGVLTFYGRPYLETVSDTARGVTLRAGAVGLAATFLIVPAFVVLVVALAVSIIGIPFLLIAVPFYPLAIAAAVALGLLATAHAIGERTAEQRNNGYEFRYRNSYAYLFTGLGMLVAPLIAANLIEMTGFLHFIGVLLKVVTWAVIWAVSTVGLGAVILSRAGTQRTFAAPAAMDPELDRDPYFDAEPTATGPHV